MLALDLPAVRELVVLAAHPDDLEIAAGGTLLALAAARPGLRVHYVLFTGVPERQAEARAAAEAFLPGARITFQVHDLPDGRLPARWAEAKEVVEAAARQVSPDLVLAPSRQDAHQDHRTVAELAPTAFRDAVIWQYEIPKWDGDLTRRNLYLPMDPATAQRKLELLHTHFPSQKGRDWWDDEVFLGLARLRGMECRSRYAEAFWCDKAVLRIGTGPR
ncbi:MAG: PIG-L family deacetylase [Micromonosporaceae bacterium]|nr:PIG-L family deacetylase [Micromonosporaceae bacterium]